MFIKRFLTNRKPSSCGAVDSPPPRKGKVYICPLYDLYGREFRRQGSEMEGTDGRFDADTLHKIDLINGKIDEINQRKMGIHTTRVEDELDRQELDAYIRQLKLSEKQRQIVDRYNKNNDARAPAATTGCCSSSSAWAFSCSSTSASRCTGWSRRARWRRSRRCTSRS